MRRIWNILVSLYAWVFISLIVLLMLPVLLIVRILDRDPVKYRTGYVFRRMGSWLTKVNPMWKVKLYGAKKIKNRRNPYVVVSNHQSMADIPCISFVPWEMKWVAKKVLFNFPVAGWLMRLAGDIPVNRSDKTSRGSVYGKARKVLDHNCSVMFFAEGTRSKNDLVLPFRDGAFKLAIDAQVPILPIAVDGSHDCLPKHSWIMTKTAHVRIEVLDPVSTENMTMADAPQLRDKVRNIIMDRLAEWRGVSRLEVDSQIPSLAWPEPSLWAKGFAEAMTAISELNQRISEAMTYNGHTDETSQHLEQLKDRLKLAMKELPQQAERNMEELHERITEAKKALADWQHRAEEKMAEMPRQLKIAIEELSAALREFELSQAPA